MSTGPEPGVEASTRPSADTAPRTVLSRRRVLRRLGIVGLMAGSTACPGDDLFEQVHAEESICPTDPVTRQQMAAFLTRRLGPSSGGAV